MCTNGRYIWNPYSRRKVFVKCGHCDACKQEVACKRSVRIRNNVSSGTIALFITLTYTNDFVPYVLQSDIEMEHLQIPVYRNCDGYYVYDRHSGTKRFVKDRSVSIIGLVDIHDLADKSLVKYPHLRGLSNDHVGVCWYPDVQNFYKRLRQILIRHYNYEKSFSYFSCVEYGGHSYRPHSHHLIFIQRDDEATFRSAICEAWPYAFRSRTSKFIEIARDAASYVSSYVNSNTSLLPLMSLDCFKQKHSSSKDFGVVLDCFTLPEILHKIDGNNLVYYSRKKFDGFSSSVALPIPKYVLLRYFPICKGFSWLSPCQLRSILLHPEAIGDIFCDFSYLANYNSVVYDLDSESSFIGCYRPMLLLSAECPVKRSSKLDNPIYHFTPRETYQMYVKLENCYQRFHSETGLSRFDYAFYYEKVWSLYASMLLKMIHKGFEDLSGDYGQFYENGFEVLDHPSISPTLSNYIIQADPNKRADIVLKTDHFRSLYSRMNKQKSVINFVMSQIYDV